MPTLTFDTHAFIKRLTDSGISEPQAEAFSLDFKDAHKSNLKELATKNDIHELKEEIKELRHEMKELELRIVIKLRSLMALSVGLIVTLVKLLK